MIDWRDWREWAAIITLAAIGILGVAIILNALWSAVEIVLRLTGGR